MDHNNHENPTNETLNQQEEHKEVQSSHSKYQEYNFKTPESQGGYQSNWNTPPYSNAAREKKEHPVLKEIGIFAAKAAIAAVLGALALGTTLTAVTKITGIDQAIERISEESNTSGDNFQGFNGNLPDFGNGSNDGGRSGEENSGENGSEEGQTDESNAEENNGPKLGVSVTTITEDMIEEGYPAGVMIAQVTEGSDAETAGLQEGDIITAFDGTVVDSNAELASLVQSSKFGKSCKVVYKRLVDGEYKAMETTVTFTEPNS